jgi:hypothetical protein
MPVLGIVVAPPWIASAEAMKPMGLQAVWFAEPPATKAVLPPDPASPETVGQGKRKASESKVLGGVGRDPGAQRIENTANSLSQGGFLGVDTGLSSTDSAERGQGSMGEGGIPDAHVIQKGDSLWSLCSKYYGDPWRWPRLWAANPAITNPHWIFPGDVVRLVDKNTGEVLARVPPTSAASDSMIAVRSGSPSTPSGTMLRELGFIEAKDLDQAAMISGSREEKIMLSSGDQAYLKFSKDRPLRAGEQYTVFDTDTGNPVRDPATGQVYGYLVRIQGDLVVDQIASQEIARGTLTSTASPIERGARVSNYIRQFKRLSPKASEVSLQARVVASFAPNSLLGPEHFVVLNRGKRDGIEVGNRTFVIRQGDGYRRTLEAWEKHDPTAPKEVVGEIWVVDVRDTTSVAWIARTTKELRVGEITEMRKGH